VFHPFRLGWNIPSAEVLLPLRSEYPFCLPAGFCSHPTFYSHSTFYSQAQPALSEEEFTLLDPKVPDGGSHARWTGRPLKAGSYPSESDTVLMRARSTPAASRAPRCPIGRVCPIGLPVSSPGKACCHPGLTLLALLVRNSSCCTRLTFGHRMAHADWARAH
jgi:hypothetical protein